jgi:putative transcriptional regulator
MEIKELRKKLRMTQLELAASLGVSVSTVARWEGSITHPSKMALKNIEIILRRKAKDLAGGKE